MVVLTGAGRRVEVLAFSHDGRMLAVPGEKGLRIWRKLTPTHEPELVPEHKNGWTVEFAPDGSKLFIDGMGGLAVRDLVNGVSTPVELWGGIACFFRLTPNGRDVLVSQYSLDPKRSCHISRRLVKNPSPDAARWTVRNRSSVCSRPAFIRGEEFVVMEYVVNRARTTGKYLLVTRSSRTGEVVREGVPCHLSWSRFESSPNGR